MRQQEELKALADKHMACLSADLSKTLNDLRYNQNALKQMAKRLQKKQQRIQPHLQEAMSKYYNCFHVDHQAMMETYNGMKVPTVDVEKQVKKQLVQLRKGCVKQFPHLFDEKKMSDALKTQLGLQ